MKTIPQNSFLKIYVMSSAGIDLYGIAHVKVDFIPLQKMYIIPMLGRFVWTTCFVQCGCSVHRCSEFFPEYVANILLNKAMGKKAWTS